MAWISFGALPCRKRNSMTTRVSMLLKSRASLTCFRACFLPGRAKDLSAPRYTKHQDGWFTVRTTTGSRGFSLFLKTSRPALRPVHPYIKGARQFFPGGKVTGLWIWSLIPHLVLRLRMGGAVRFLTPQVMYKNDFSYWLLRWTVRI